MSNLPIRLFSTTDLTSVLTERRRKMSEEIEKVDILQLAILKDDNITALAEQLNQKYSFQLPILEENKIEAYQEEHQIDVSKDQRRLQVSTLKPFFKGVKITFYVPFKGSKELFCCYPSNRIDPSTRPKAVVGDQELQLIYCFSVVDQLHLNNLRDQDISNIKKWLQYLQQELKKNSFFNEAKNHLEVRKREYFKNQGFIENLGVPIRKKETLSPQLIFQNTDNSVDSTQLIDIENNKINQQITSIHLGKNKTMRKITWLHLTDLHQGLSGQQWLYPSIRQAFYDDLEKLHNKINPIDLVLFTGDLTQGDKTKEGHKKQFDALESTLQDLWEHLAKLGSSPKLLVVPGNHDLLRPNSKAAVIKALNTWHLDEEVREEFWKDPNSEYRKTIERAFAEYQEWLESTQIPLVGYNKGLLPGDFSAKVEKDGIRLGVVGLNSAFLQLTGADYLGKLDLHVQQLQEACSPDLPKWLGQHDFSILMTHHPITWLSKEAQDHFNENIYTPKSFLVHAFGHMHEPNQTTFSTSGSNPKRYLQGASLFGRETWLDDKNNKQQQRIHGYSIGSISIDIEPTLTIWPRIATKALGGHYRFDRDTRFEIDEDTGSYQESLKKK